MSLTKKKLVEKLVKEMNMNSVVAVDVVSSFFDSIKKSLTDGEDVKLSGFGNFTLNDKAERPGRNPKTGEVHTVSARRVVTFKAGTKLKEIVNAE